MLSRVLLCYHMDCSLPGSSVHEILQVSTLEWVAIPFSRGIFPRIKPRSPALQTDSLLSEPPVRKGLNMHKFCMTNLYFRASQEMPSGKEPACQCRRHKTHGFNPWVGKIPWRRKWQPTPVFFPGESHGQRSLAGYSPWGYKESDMTEVT